MTIENLSLFKAIGAKMDFLSQRQRLISQNISHADTPGYLPQDVKEGDFSRTLGRLLQSKSQQQIGINLTSPMHMTFDGSLTGDEIDQKTVYEVAPVGNAVVMEEQLLNSNKTMGDYSLMTSLYQKNMAMLRTALGRGG